ncbi:MAG: LPXTG cell wall anchor domain-containing protein, partial [Christensenellaceae bacterium]|nr:LPXTG cell wall anchor domain-containing protein [Christensenellaceae bacterium]
KLIKPELNIKAVKKESVQKTTETNEVIRIRSEVLFNIEDEDVPLASVPKTGDNTITLAAVIFSALLAVILINVKGKRTEK